MFKLKVLQKMCVISNSPTSYYQIIVTASIVIIIIIIKHFIESCHRNSNLQGGPKTQTSSNDHYLHRSFVTYEK